MGRAASGRWGRVPRWVVLILGAICVLVGATLVTRPFQSLAVLIILVAAGFILTGLSELVDRDEAPDPWPTTIAAIGMILLGLATLLWPGLSLQTLTLIVGLALISSGLSRAVSALRGGGDDRAAGLLLGAASIILGIVALFWPDITLLVVAVVFGVQLIVFGLSRISNTIRGPRPKSGARGPGGPSRFGGFVKTAGAALALLISLALAVVSIRLNRGAPVVDAFYKAPDQIPATPGALLRSEPMSQGIPAGARAWRILYTTTRADGTPALASGLVVAAQNLPAGPRPVIAWAHGTTGVDETCAPSLLDDPFAAGAAPAIDQVIANGWVLVGTDYIGLGTEGPHGYLVGQEAGRAVLDAVRAARQLPELSLADSAVVWGHSQGGGAALWTGIVAPSYAPDANVIGVAALAPASDLPGLVSNLDVVPGGSIFGSYVIQGYSDAYPDVRFDEYVRPTARILAREMASRCLAEPAVFASVVETLVIDKSIWSADPASGAFGQRLSENVPSGAIPAPLLVGQGLGDELVLPTAQEAFVGARCAAGYQVEYRTYAGFDHVGVVGADSPLIPDLLAWTQDRLDGKPAASTC
jgi:uncharacterized membrane protein HdeD (DUF308 family)/alpha-beta hydrolase superfamily lysophospholipase